MLSRTDLQKVIVEYVRTATHVVAALRSELGYQNLTAAVAAGKFPRSSEFRFPGLGIVSYQFHGRGCYVKSANLRIDIELCGESEVIAFDSWRLYRYATETLKMQHIESEDIQSLLDKMVYDQEVRFSNSPPFFGLYFLPVVSQHT